MANPEHLGILTDGIEAWNEWRQANPEIRPDLVEADLRLASLSKANLSGADLKRADFKEADLSEANLSNANLDSADLQQVDLRKADLKSGNLNTANLNRANMREADLRGADLSQSDLSEADISKANLRGAALGETNLRGANLSWADLNDVDLNGTILYGAKLSGANLSDADLIEANLRQADLRATDFTGADLTDADLSGADLRGAQFSKVILGSTTFNDVDFRMVEGLSEVQHWGPSSIGIDTIYRSQGKIPAEFLRGAGIPDKFIEYITSLVGTAFEFYSCFISYSSKDQKFADRLFADLQKEGVRCWFAPHHAKAGEKLHEQIDTAIRLHERLLLILSPDSINSEWVKTEIAKARKREIKEGRRVLFPILLDISFEELKEWEYFDADRGKDSAREIREYYIPDFTGWKDHDKYEEEFKKLLRDLKKAASPVVQ